VRIAGTVRHLTNIRKTRHVSNAEGPTIVGQLIVDKGSACSVTPVSDVGVHAE
jgi:hypothetical protein